eukprot:SAG31_NODE_572_length_13974_cov_28.935640_10_plen_118_part_00
MSTDLRNSCGTLRHLRSGLFAETIERICAVEGVGRSKSGVHILRGRARFWREARLDLAIVDCAPVYRGKEGVGLDLLGAAFSPDALCWISLQQGRNKTLRLFRGVSVIWPNCVTQSN